MNVKIVRTMAKYGTASSLVGALMIYISVSMTPSWSFSQSLAALGAEGFGAVIFESGLLMAGAMIMIFSAGLFEYTDGEIFGKIGSAGVLLIGLTASALGISIIDFGEYRDALLMVLFPVIPISLALLSINLYRRGLKPYAGLGGVASLISAYPIFTGGPATALQELMIFVPFSIWQIAIGLHMYRLEVPEEA